MIAANLSMEVTAMRILIIAFVTVVALAGCGSNGSTSAPTAGIAPIDAASPAATP
jgi:uncharacterized protein YceK